MSSSSNISISSDEVIDDSSNINVKGKYLRNYSIIKEIGRGSYSIVWLAYNKISKKFYAIKIQNHKEYYTALKEVRFVSLLPKIPDVFNNLVEYFIEKDNKKQYLCSVWNLCKYSLDFYIRKIPQNNNGLSLIVSNNIMKQLITAVSILHKKYKVFHGDIKTDNILIKGINTINNFICSKYLENINNIDHTESKHIDFIDSILNDINIELQESIIDTKSNDTDLISIQLSDFGSAYSVKDKNMLNFGTRYYQAPEIILEGPCSYPVDIWALGCTYYEILSGKILFDPIKDSNYSRDYYHLSLINDTCGNFPYSFLKTTKKYTDFFKNKRLYNYVPSKINRLDDKLNKLSIPTDDITRIKLLLVGCLHIQPNKRYNIDDLIKTINIIP